MRPLVGTAALAALLCMAAGCTGGNQGATSNDPAASESTPATTSAPAEMKLASVSKYDAGPRAFEAPEDEAGAKRGEQLFKDKGCSACHAFGKKVTGPDLAGVSQRRTAVWLENQILHPDVMVKTDPIAHELFAKHMLQMPNQGLTPEEAKAVIAFFRHRDHEAGEAHEKEEDK